MDKKRKTTIYYLGLLFAIINIFVLLNMAGCNLVNKGIKEADKEIGMSSETPVPTSSLMTATPGPAEIVAIHTPTTIPCTPTPGVSDMGSKESDEEYIEIDITEFRDLNECFIDYSFTVTKNGSEENPSSFEVQGMFDLNQDGILEEIGMLLIGHVEHRSDEIQAYIKVDSQQKEINMDHTTDGEVAIVDLDKNDNYFEIACFDEGPSGDPNYKIYRYDGEILYYIGDINTFASALADGKGKVISGFNRSVYFTPSFCSSCMVVEDNTFVQKIVAIEEYIGKTFEFSGGDVYFWPCGEMPEQFEMRWEPEYLRHFEVCEIKLLDIYQLDKHTMDAYFVEFPVGERGMLYFWIGD